VFFFKDDMSCLPRLSAVLNHVLSSLNGDEARKHREPDQLKTVMKRLRNNVILSTQAMENHLP